MPLNVAFIPYIQFLRWNGSSIFTIFLNVNIDKLRMVNKKLSISLTLLTLMSFWLVNNTWKYSSMDNIPTLKQSDLIFSNIAKTYIVKGNLVGSSILGKDIRSYRLVPTNQEMEEINSTIWPSIGSDFFLSKNNPIEIVGALSTYNGIWQINPLSSKHIHSDIDAISLTDALTLKDEYIENIGPVNLVYKKIRAKSGKIHLHLIIYDKDILVKGIMYEGKYDNSLLDKIDNNSSFYLNAEIGEYNGKPSFTVKSIELSNEELKKTLGNQKGVYTLKESSKFEGTNQKIIIGPLTSVSSNLTKTGEHLKFDVMQDNIIASGIFFDKDWDKETRSILDQNKSFFLRVKVTTYNSKISLQSDWIIPSE